MDLVILPCHSIWKGTGRGESASDWHLASFQHAGEDHLCFKEHITSAMEYLQAHPNSTLVISGGATKLEAGPISEAISYWNLAKLEGAKEDPRIAVEEYARDSLENVVFSICRYFELHGRYPSSICVIGFEFKRRRFTEFHLPALGYAVEQMEYIGNSPTPTKDIDSYFEELLISEDKHAVSHFATDAYGRAAPLGTKKSFRNPFNRVHQYRETNPELEPFLNGFDDNESTDAQLKELLRDILFD